MAPLSGCAWNGCPSQRGIRSVDHALGQHGFAQGIDQRLELHAGLSDPLRQCRAGDGQAGTAKDFLLPVQRQVVGGGLVRASLAHGKPGDKGYRVRLKIRGHHHP